MLKARATSAASWTTVGSIGRVVLQVTQVTVLTRLLTPDDFGLMAIVMVMVSLGSLFSDGGLSSAFVHRRGVTDADRSSLYWLNVLLATSVALLVIGTAPILAWFYRTPTIAWIVLICSPIFVLGAIGRQFEIASEKSLRFRPLVLIELGSGMLGVLIAIMCALTGLGIYSLALAALATALSRTALAVAAFSSDWRPQTRLRWSEVQPFLGFGGATVASNIVNHFNSTIDVLIGGRLLGTDALGLYSVPRSLVLNVQSAVNPIVTRVGFPVIAELQHDREAVRRAYQMVLNVVATAGAPVYMGLAVLSAEICDLLLGPSWKGSAKTLSLLAVWAAFRSLGNPAGALLLGVGRASVALYWNLSLLAVYPLALWVGSAFGPTGLAASLLVSAMALFIPGWRWLVYPYTEWRFSSYAKTTILPLCNAACSLLLSSWCACFAQSSLARVALTVSIGGGAYLLLTWLTNPPIVRIARSLWVRRATPQT